MTIRFATRDDVAAWFGGRVPSTMRAMVLEVDGRVAAIAGIAQGPAGLQVFSEIAEDRPGRMALGRFTVRFADLLKTAGPAFAICSATEPTSPGLLAHLGFEDCGGNIWRRG